MNDLEASIEALLEQEKVNIVNQPGLTRLPEQTNDVVVCLSVSTSPLEKISGRVHYSSLTSLSVSECPLRTLDLSCFPALNHCWIYQCPLAELRVQSGCRLTKLSLIHCKISSLEFISSMKLLKECNVESDNMAIAHPGCLDAPALTTLILGACKINRLGDLPCLESLIMLAHAVPQGLEKLTRLKRLRIRRVGTGFDRLRELVDLEELNLAGPCINIVPRMGCPDYLANMSQLKILAIRNIRATLPSTLPATLSSVTLVNTGLDTIPDALVKLPNLTKLFIYRDSLKELPGDLFSLQLTNFFFAAKEIPTRLLGMQHLEHLGLCEHPSDVFLEELATTNIKPQLPVDDLKRYKEAQERVTSRRWCMANRYQFPPSTRRFQAFVFLCAHRNTQLRRLPTELWHHIFSFLVARDMAGQAWFALY